METKEIRNRKVSVNLTETEHRQLVKEAERTRIPKATLCRKLITEGFVRIEFREPEEMAVLEQILEAMSQILETDMEMLRQLRLMGEWTDEAQRAVEEQAKELCLLRQKLEGEETRGDH